MLVARVSAAARIVSHKPSTPAVPVGLGVGVRCSVQQARCVCARVGVAAPSVLEHTLGSRDPSQGASAPNTLATALLAASLRSYLSNTPSVSTAVAVLTGRGGVLPATLAHDHYAYRTFGLPGLGIASVAAVLTELGYTLAEEGLLFPTKKLSAAWFAPKDSPTDVCGLPRIFVSEIKVHELSPGAQAIIRRHVEGVHLGPAGVATSMATGQLPWPHVSQSDYETVLRENDYAAWVLMHGYALNHTALAVHRMRTEAGAGLTLQQAADLMSQYGLTMNTDGGLLKVSPDGLLRQCSSMSDWIAVEPSPTPHGGSGAWKVPGSYLELVERDVMPQYTHLQGSDVREEHRRDGFEVGNASHLFTSTRVA